MGLTFDDLRRYTSSFLTKEVCIKVIEETEYTLVAKDKGKILVFTATTAITLTLPDSLKVGFNVGVIQQGAGQITFTINGSAVLQNSNGFTTSNTQYSALSLFVVENTDGVSATYSLAGDGA